MSAVLGIDVVCRSCGRRRRSPEARPLAHDGLARALFTHVVEPGDTLSEIARRYAIPVDELARRNGVSDPNRIRAGDRLEIPERSYVVLAGDTLSGIASRFGISTETLARINGLTDPNRIQAGQRLIVPGIDPSVPPAPPAPPSRAPSPPPQPRVPAEPPTATRTPGCPRNPPIATQPTFEHTPPSSGRHYTDWVPVAMAAAIADVARVIAGGSFVERVTGVITVDGHGKNFLTITGLDGVTFGITDFASDGGVHSFMRLFDTTYPGELARRFGASNARDLLDARFIARENDSRRGAGADDKGLVRHRWFREGLDGILCDRRYNGLQLAEFARGKVDPSLATFRRAGLTSELLLATMIGIANSYGHHGMESGFFTPAMASATGRGSARELDAVERMLRAYVAGDHRASERTAATQLLDLAFGRGSGSAPRASALGHRGGRARLLLARFPTTAAFSALGHYTLDPTERFAGHPTTA